MANIDKRLNYFNGQFLQDVDFKTEQDYRVDRERRHNRLMHTFGIAEGLNVTASVGASTVGVTPGTGLDSQGHQIVLFDIRTLQLGPQQTQFFNKTVLVVISYAESLSDDASVGGSGKTRIWESPVVEIVIEDASAPPPDVKLRLARLTIDGGGLVSANADITVRVLAGARVGTEVDVPLLKVMTPGLAQNLWPALTSIASGELDLAGSLVVSGAARVGGDLGVTGRVTGADLLVNGVSVGNHLGDKTNPHGTTATQVGALIGVGGLSNPGGSIGVVGSGSIIVSADAVNKRISLLSNSPASITGITNPGADIGLVAGNTGLVVAGDQANHRIVLTTNAPATVAGVSNPAGDIGLATGGAIVITPDNTGKRITVSENHSGNVNNPHATTAAQVGAITGVAGVTNAGGGVNLAQGGAIVITPDNTANKRITISETHSALTGNPHGTLAAQLADYDLGRRATTFITWNSGNASGSTQSITVGFQPKTLLIYGYSYAAFSSGSFGGVISGFADLRSGISQYGFGPSCVRQTPNPTYQVSGVGTINGGIVEAYFYDLTVTPATQLDVIVSVASVSVTGVTFQITRNTYGTNSPINTFVVNMVIFSLG